MGHTRLQEAPLGIEASSRFEQPYQHQNWFSVFEFLSLEGIFFMTVGSMYSVVQYSMLLHKLMHHSNSRL